MMYKKKSKNVSIRCTGHVKITEIILLMTANSKHNKTTTAAKKENESYF